MDTPPAREGSEFPTPEHAARAGPVSMVAGAASRRYDFVRRARRCEKDLQYADFFLTMTSAYSSLNKFQRETLEKQNLLVGRL
jgi:hypothetical protein